MNFDCYAFPHECCHWPARPLQKAKRTYTDIRILKFPTLEGIAGVSISGAEEQIHFKCDSCPPKPEFPESHHGTTDAQGVVRFSFPVGNGVQWKIPDSLPGYTKDPVALSKLGLSATAGSCRTGPNAVWKDWRREWYVFVPTKNTR